MALKISFTREQGGGIWGRAGQMGVPLKQALRRTKDMFVVMREGL